MGGKGSGRRPKPVEQKVRLGNPSKRPLPKAEVIVAFPQQSLDPLRPLGTFGKDLWDRIWISGAAWIRASIDAELIQMVCEQVDERGRLRAIVLQDASDWRSRRALRELDRQIASLLGQLGFSPTDRAGLGVAEQKDHEFLDLHRRIQAKRQAEA
jgi:hypothetical protein